MPDALREKGGIIRLVIIFPFVREKTSDTRDYHPSQQSVVKSLEGQRLKRDNGVGVVVPSAYWMEDWVKREWS